jgi:hypothetical protein
MTRPPRQEMSKKLRRTGTGRENSVVANKRGVSLKKSTGRWQAMQSIGGKRLSLGYFGNEEEAARAWDRFKLWSCKAGGKKEEEVQLNFLLSDYSDDEVAALQGLTQEEMIQNLRRTEERVANKSSKYTGVSLDKGTGRWRGDCWIGGKQTYLGNFVSEEEAARAFDRFKLWSCKVDGKKKEEVELNFPLSEYNDAEVTALQGLTQEEIIQKLRRSAKAVERPAPPDPVALAPATSAAAA